MGRYQEIEQRHAREDERQIDADVATVMRTPEGRRLFMAVLAKSGVYRQSRPNALEYDAGRRDAGLEILHIVNRHAPQAAFDAMRERNELVAKRNAELETAAREDDKEKGKAR